MVSLEQLSGLSDADPIYDKLKLVDECLKELHQHDWNEIHRRLPQDKLIDGMWTWLGHPLGMAISEDCVLLFQAWLHAQGEPVLADLVGKLVERRTQPHEVRWVMLFILANLEYIKQLEGPVRSLYAGWIE